MTDAAPTGFDPQTVPGWGVDANPANNPTYPMRDRATGSERGLSWTRPPLQRSAVEVLLSIEHNRLPAVFGTSAPPSGLSGAIRRRAFKYSESQWAHWLLLMLSDRINMVEGVVEDVVRGRPPNLVEEFGLTSRVSRRQSRGARATALSAIGLGGAVLLVGYLIRRVRPL